MLRFNGAQKKLFSNLPENPRGFYEAEIVVRNGKVTIRMIEAKKGDVSPSLSSVAYNGTRTIEEGKETIFTTQRMPTWENKRMGQFEYLQGKEGQREGRGGPLEVDFMRLLKEMASRPDFLHGLSEKSKSTLKSALSRDGIFVPQLQLVIDAR